MKDNFVEGLYVKNGRLSNDRPDGMMGIEKAANRRSMVKKQENIAEIAEGIRRAQMLEKFMDQFNSQFSWFLSVEKLPQGGFFALYCKYLIIRLMTKISVYDKNMTKIFEFVMA